jgi:periplasmic protein TonB
MAYTNLPTSNAKGGTVLAVAALDVAAVYALINGLGIEYVTNAVFNLPTTNYPATPETQPPVDPQQPDAAAKPRDAVVPARPMVSNSGSLVFTLPPLDPPGVTDFVLPEIADTGPLAAPGPRFEPLGASPRGNPGNWVTPNDYPTRDIRQGNEGTALFRLAIDANGQITGCEITRSSGHPGLDAATCNRISHRGRFEPARDASGERVVGKYNGSIKWVIPR